MRALAGAAPTAVTSRHAVFCGRSLVLTTDDWAPSSVVEHVTFNHVVLGSIPRGPTNFKSKFVSTLLALIVLVAAQ